MKKLKSSAVTDPTRFPGSFDDEPTHYASFILRCWIGEGGRLYARLIDIRTGVGHVVGSLALLPNLVHRLVANAPPADAETQAELSQGSDQTNSNDGR